MVKLKLFPEKNHKKKSGKIIKKANSQYAISDSERIREFQNGTKILTLKV